MLNACIGYFIGTDPERGPYYGMSGYWCGITPAYLTGRYTSEYLFLLVSAAFSFILSSLVFLRLRDNITVSAGHKVHFHCRSKGVVGRMGARTFVVTDDQHAESHLTTVAKQMLRHPIAYTVLVLPICVTFFSYPSGPTPPFPATVSTAAVFVLSGFVNVVLFCLPGSWEQKPGTGTTLYSASGDIGLSSRTNMTRRLTKPGRKMGKKPASFALGITVEKDIDIKYDEIEPGASCPISGITLPTEPLRAHSMQRHGPSCFHIREILFPPPLCLELDWDDPNKDLSTGAHPANQANRIAWDVPQHPVHSSRRRESGMHQTTAGSEAPSRVYPFDMLLPVNTDA